MRHRTKKEPVEEIVQVLDACTPRVPGRYGELSAMRLRALIILLWRSGLRISEALALEDGDLIPRDHAVVVRCGKGGKRRISAMDDWAWQELDAWMTVRSAEIPPGAVFSVLRGRGAGRALSATDARRQMRQLGAAAGLRKRFAPHQLRHTHAVELWREGIDLLRVSKQLGHANLSVTQSYMEGVAMAELLEPIGQRRAPMMPVPASRR